MRARCSESNARSPGGAELTSRAPTRWLPMLVMGAFAHTVASCGPAAPSRGVVLEAGVGHARFEARWNNTDLVPVHIYFPSDETGAPTVTAAPALVFIQGGFVSVSRYEWQAIELVRQGFVVAMPEHPAALAFFSIENGLAARELFAHPPSGSLLNGLVDTTSVFAAGHSLGGVVAAKLWLSGGFAGLIMQASFADQGDVEALKKATLPSLFLAGENDCQAKRADIAASWNNVPTASALVTVRGMTHYAFTDSLAEDERSGCSSGITLEDAHAKVMTLMVPFMKSVRQGQGLDWSIIAPPSEAWTVETK